MSDRRCALSGLDPRAFTTARWACVVLDRRSAEACSSRAGWLRRQLGLALWLLNVLTFVAAMQVSGLPHQVVDLVVHDDCADDCEHSDTDDDDDGSECPPGCPTCHNCVHAQALYVPENAAGLTMPPAMNEGATEPRDDAPPTNPFRDSVFRPPRA